MDAIVVGAGLAGLAAAHRLRARGLDVVVLERSSRPGGAVHTVHDDEWLLEQGPHAVDTSGPALRALLSDAKVDPDLLVSATPSSWERFVVRSGRRRPVPLTPVDFLRSDVLPFSAKLRFLLEPFVRRRAMTDEESVAAFASRRFGSKTLDLVDAVVTGVHAGDPRRLSVRAAIPTLVEAERAYGSVLRGMAKRPRRKRRLVAPLGGMERLVAALCEGLTVRTGVQVDSVEEGPDGAVIDCGDGTRYTTRHLVLAASPGAVAEMLGATRPDVPTAPVAIVGLGFRNADLPADAFRGYGTLHPHTEGLFTLGMLHESTLFPGRAPPGHSLVRALVGGRRAADRADLSDDVLVHGVLDDLERIIGITAKPVFSRVLRNRPGIPQLELHHQTRIEPIARAVEQMDSVAVAGWGWSGIGIEDSIASGQYAARSILSNGQALDILSAGHSKEAEGKETGEDPS